MAAVTNQVCEQVFGVGTTQITAGRVRLPYLKHQLPCALSKQHAHRAGEPRPASDRQRMPGLDRWAARLAAVTERLITSCFNMWPATSPVRIG
jgi:hypothetical protein